MARMSYHPRRDGEVDYPSRTEKFDPNWRDKFSEEERKFLWDLKFTDGKTRIQAKRYLRKKDGKDIMNIMGAHLWYWGEVLDEDDDYVVTREPETRLPTDNEWKSALSNPISAHAGAYEIKTGDTIIGYHHKRFIEDNRFKSKSIPESTRAPATISEAMQLMGFVNIALPEWLANEKGCPEDLVAKIKERRPKAIYVEDIEGKKYWLPLSQIKIKGE